MKLCHVTYQPATAFQSEFEQRSMSEDQFLRVEGED